MKTKDQILTEILLTEPNEILTTDELISDYDFYNKLIQSSSKMDIDESEYEPGFMKDHRN
jgi:hypothetical protein